jgi:carboxylesterase type B
MSSKPQYHGPTHTFAHAQLGELKGRLIDSPHFPGSPVIQFRSIPYATVPKRFLPSVLLTEIPSTFDRRPHRDFTHFGAACPQPGATKPAWFGPQGGKLADDEILHFDEFTCLTISISVPESQLSSSTTKTLPVMVYIHGGAAQDGCGHVDGVHNNAPLAAFSHSISLPVIVVNIGYRLNWLGSLVCQDLLDEHVLNPTSAHGPFNLTIQDQRNAFAWIHKFINGFGGDVSNITAFGESAGSIFTLYHIIGSEKRMFDRAILQSGVVIGDLPFNAKETEYQTLLKHFNIHGATAEERLEQLRQVDATSLAEFPGTHTLPFVGEIRGVKREDSLFTRGSATYSSQFDLTPTNTWLGDVMIGDDLWEGQTILEILKRSQPKVFVDAISSFFGKATAEGLLEAYDIPISGGIDSNLFLLQLSYFIGDTLFSAPINKLASILARTAAPEAGVKKRKVYRYSIALSNPFVGSTHSYAPGHHFVEILFLFLTLLDRYPTRRGKWLEQQARETARRWITFANGREPWEEYRISPDGKDASEAKIAIADDLHGWTTRTLSEDEEVSKNDPWGGRRYAGWRALEKANESLRGGDDVSEETYAALLNAVRLQILKVVATPVTEPVSNET